MNEINSWLLSIAIMVGGGAVAYFILGQSIVAYLLLWCVVFLAIQLLLALLRLLE